MTTPSLEEPSRPCTSPVSSLQRGADSAEDVRHHGAEHGDDRDRDDGDQREQQRVLDEGLALLALLELEPSEGEIRPRRERTNGIHHFSSFWASAHAPARSGEASPRLRITNRAPPRGDTYTKVIETRPKRCF